MIGQGYPYKDTGWSILEEGELGYLPNPPMPTLIISHFLIIDPRGQTVHKTDTKDQAYTWIENNLSH